MDIAEEISQRVFMYNEQKGARFATKLAIHRKLKAQKESKYNLLVIALSILSTTFNSNVSKIRET